MEVRTILGIDPGTSITGYGIIRCKGKKMSFLNAGVLQLGKQKVPHTEKLRRIFLRISGLIDEYQPDELAIEAPFHGKNVQSMLKLGRAQGVAMAAGLVKGLPIYEYAPRKVKMAVTGRGTASKEQVAAMLEQLLDFKREDALLDASDGLAVAVCHFFQGNVLTPASGYKSWAAFVQNNPGRVK
ncbi:MAG: crossover junction endodeoxyribonuclease RuvC [Bacteroidetes bacterium]|nr:MAG: crossover junction endodeoxyribonuclease RuvC [Bacteroidota bacterium]